MQCAATLSAVFYNGFSTVMTQALEDEWLKHKSRFASRWLSRMYSTRRVDNIKDVRMERLRHHVKSAESPVEQAAMDKDCHLPEAAVARKALVSSLDDKARALFARAAADDYCWELRSVVWFNPSVGHDDVIVWITTAIETPQDYFLFPKAASH